MNSNSSETSSNDESPYKHLAEIKYVDLDKTDNDFKTPKPVKLKKTVRAQNKSNKKTTVKLKNRKSSKNVQTISKYFENPLLKSTENTFKNSDVDPDQLQMVLALSESTYAMEHPDSNTYEDVPSSSSESSKTKMSTLEKFGFKSTKSSLPTNSKRQNKPLKRSKSSKYRFITPILLMRTNEERESLIESKISLILNKSTQKNNFQQRTENNLFSEVLKPFYTADKSSCLFQKGHLENPEITEFYCKSLCFVPAKNNSGSLLKNWADIPGREKSPIPVYSNEKNIKDKIAKNLDLNLNVNENKNDLNENKDNEMDLEIEKDSDSLNRAMCLSPDLFGSDNSDHEIEPKTPENNFADCLSQSLVSISPNKSKIRSFEIKKDKISPKTLDFSLHSSTVSPKKNPLEKSQLKTERFNFSLSFSPKKNQCQPEMSNKNSVNNSPNKSAENNTIIEHFETFNDNVFDLTISSDENTEELFTKSVHEKSVTIDLTESTSSDTKTNDKVLATEVCSKKSDRNKTELVNDNKQSLTNTNLIFHHISSMKNIENTKGTLDQISSQSKDRIDDGKSSSEDFSLRLSLSEEKDNDLDFPLQINNLSDNGLKNEIDKTDTLDETPTKNQRNSSRISLETYNLENFDSRNASLNVTDYINKLLHSNKEQIDWSNLDDNHPNLSQESCSQESLLSDEELNYSYITSKNLKNRSLSENSSELSDEIEKKIADEMDLDTELDDFDKLNDATAGQSNEKQKNVNKEISRKKNLNEISELEDFITVSSDDENEKNSQVFAKTSTQNCNFYHLSDEENLPENNVGCSSNPVRFSVLKRKYQNDEIEPLENKIETESPLQKLTPSSPEISSSSSNSENNVFSNNINNQETSRCQILTPNNNVIIKTRNITPMENYSDMDTPNISEKLQKFGVKPLKRRRGVKLLKYLYECTHPIVLSAEENQNNELSSDEEEQSPKRTKYKENVNNFSYEPQNVLENVEIIEGFLDDEKPEDLIFERKRSLKILSCPVPLQIIFRNFVSCNPEIHKKILLYEPLQLEVIHKMVNEQSSCKFHIQDLLTFLDKKCITIRTSRPPHQKKKNLKSL